MLTVVLILLQTTCWQVQARLSVVSSSSESMLVRSGDRGKLWCQTSQPWFLCVWKGPNDMAITKTQNHECNGNRSNRMRVTGRGTMCQLDISDVQLDDAGEYSCVLADKEDVVTVTRDMFLSVGVASSVHWVQGQVVQYNPGQKISLTCEASAGNPRPNIVIRAQSMSLTEESSSMMERSSVSREVSVDTTDIANNTVVTCHAEQRDELTGVLVYNSTVVQVRLEQVIIPLPLGECMDWWCEYQVFLFIMLVMFFLIIISCCGMYFFFATRGKPYNIVMYNSEHGTWNRDDTMQDVKEKLVERKEAGGGGGILKNTKNVGLKGGADIIRINDSLNQSLYSQVDKTKKTVKKEPSPTPLPVKAPVLETDFDQTQDSIIQRVHTDFDSTINESTSFLSKDISASNATTLPDTSKLEDTTENITDAAEEERKRMMLTMTEEEIIEYNSETTMEMIYKKYRNKNKSQTTLDEEELDDEFIGETEMRKYALHKYHLDNLKNVKRLGRTYSKVVRDHLSNNPKLAVSESSVEFEVARPSSRLSYCNRSNASSPFPSRKGTPQN